MVVRVFAGAVLIVALSLAGCSSSKQAKQTTLGSIDGTPIRLAEFEDMMARNYGGWEQARRTSMEERKHFLGLFVAYKLKLLEARNRGLPQDTAFQREIREYRSSAASTFVVEKELIEPALKLMYERRAWELRASHILLTVEQNAPPEDTLKAYRRAQELIALAQSADFDSLARQHSEDPSAVQNGGDLGWFSQGKMVRPFEDAAFALAPGQVSPVPVRTQFGYHVIKVLAREPNKGLRQIAHVLKRFSTTADSASVRKTMDSVYAKITSGGLTFEQAVEQYSDDPSTKMRQGVIGQFGRSQMTVNIASLLFSIPVGTLTEPFAAPYGYHLFKVNAELPMPSFREVEPELRQYYQQMSYVEDYERLIQDLKKTYRLSFDAKLRYQLVQSFDSTLTPSSDQWTGRIPVEWMNSPLFTFADRSVTVRRVLELIESSQEFSGSRLTSRTLDTILDRIVDGQMLEYHTQTVDQRHPGFTALMMEYENGVLIFRMDQDEIWAKVQPTDSALRAFYEIRKDHFFWPQRTNFSEIFVSSDSLAKALYNRAMAGEDFGDLAAQYTTRPGMKEKKGEWGLTPAPQNELTVMSLQMPVGSISPPTQFENGWSVIKILEKDDERLKTFEEALPDLRSQYQEFAAKERQKSWIESLKSKYRVTENPDAVSEAFKEPRDS